MRSCTSISRVSELIVSCDGLGLGGEKEILLRGPTGDGSEETLEILNSFKRSGDYCGTVTLESPG